MKGIKYLLICLGLFASVQSNAADPTVQASSVAITARGQNYLTASWSRGNGQRCLVVCKPSANAYSYPSDGQEMSYNASSAYGSGDHLGNSNYVVADVTGTSLTIVGLAASTQYT